MLDELGLLKIVADCRLSLSTPVVVGVSGGADSLCLLAVLRRIGFSVIVAHFNHQLRADADGDEAFVAAVARSFGFQFAAGRENVADYANRHHQSIEEAARNRRYAFLFKTAGEVGAQAVAVGHTADDQVETVLMHLLRGSGLSGLRGMAARSINPDWSDTIPVVRPLLETWRAETLAVCAAEGITPVSDSTNQDKAYRRNRLRLELIPLLETYNPQLRETIRRTAIILGDDDDWIAAAAASAWQKLTSSNTTAGIILDRAGFLRESPSIQRRLLRKAIETLRTLKDIDLAAIERARTFIQTPSRSRSCDLAAHLNLAVDAERIFIAPWGQPFPGVSGPAVLGEQPAVLPQPGRMPLSDGWYIDVDLPSLPDLSCFAADGDPDTAYVDASGVTPPLVVRGRRPGDRWQPYGWLDGSQKLSDYFINEKSIGQLEGQLAFGLFGR